jgi:hypothetical protein
MKFRLALLLWLIGASAFAQTSPINLTPPNLGSGTANLGGNLVTGGALTTTGTGPTTLAFPSSTATFTFPSATKTLMASDYSNGTTLTSNAFLTGGGAATAPNAVAISGLVLGNGASAPTAVTYNDETAWTPAIAFGGAAVGVTYTAQTGLHSRTGNGTITAFFVIILSSKGSSTGAATITGLPIANKVNYIGSCSIDYYAAMTGITTTKPYIGSGASAIIIAVPSGTDNNTSLLDTAFTNTTTIQGSCRYQS